MTYPSARVGFYPGTTFLVMGWGVKFTQISVIA